MPDICASQAKPPAASTRTKLCAGEICPAGIAVAAAQAIMNMYGPGGPIFSALPIQVATMAISATVGTTAQGTAETVLPIATTRAKARAMIASSMARLGYGRPRPYNAVKPPVAAISPAWRSPASQPASTGVAMHSAARTENSRRGRASGRSWNMVRMMPWSGASDGAGGMAGAA